VVNINSDDTDENPLDNYAVNRTRHRRLYLSSHSTRSTLALSGEKSVDNYFNNVFFPMNGVKKVEDRYRRWSPCFSFSRLVEIFFQALHSIGYFTCRLQAGRS
jgi:hypothetical protein